MRPTIKRNKLATLNENTSSLANDEQVVEISQLQHKQNKIARRQIETNLWTLNETLTRTDRHDRYRSIWSVYHATGSLQTNRQTWLFTT